MPDLATLPAPAPVTLSARASTAPQTPNTVSFDPSLSTFLGHLQQSLGGTDSSASDAGSAKPQTAGSVKAETKHAQPQINGQPSLTNASPAVPPSGLPAKSAPPPQTANKKTVEHESAAPLGQSPDATTSPDPPTPPIPAAVPSNTATPTPPTLDAPRLGPQAPALGPPVDPKSANEAEGTAGTSPGNVRSKPRSDPSAPPDATSASATQDQPIAHQTTQTAAAALLLPIAPAPVQVAAGGQIAPATSGRTTPERSAASSAAAQSGAPEPGRTKLAPGVPASATPPPSTDPAILQPATAPAPDVAATPHLAAAPTLQPAAPSATQAPPATGPSPPSLQVAQAVAEPIRVVLAASPQQPGAPHVTTIQLAPVELGRVDIRIERTGDGPARVQLAAERPETLLRLIHDQPQLHQALDQAGIPQNGRTITFTLAADSGTTGATFSSSGGNGASSGNGQRSPPQGYSNSGDPASDSTAPLPPMPAWSRSGLDITA